jgi:hypothetical protein
MSQIPLALETTRSSTTPTTVSFTKQEREVLSMFVRCGSRGVTQRNALHDIGVGSASLSAVIMRLRAKGTKIVATRHKNPVTGDRYSSYRLASS